jgi:YgiT-type zinc finger domain-containing protein
MKCVICKHGETAPGLVTVSLQRKETTVIFKNVPAEVCNNCGEYFLDEKITERLTIQAKNAVKNGAEVEILRFVA